MKLLYALLALAFLAAPGMAMNESDSAYLEGIQDGYALGYAAIAGLQISSRSLGVFWHRKQVDVVLLRKWQCWISPHEIPLDNNKNIFSRIIIHFCFPFQATFDCIFVF